MKPGCVKVVDRVSAVEEIMDLLFLNRLMVERLKLISQARATSLMTSFTKGDRVGFLAPDGRMPEGMVLRRLICRNLESFWRFTKCFSSHLRGFTCQRGSSQWP